MNVLYSRKHILFVLIFLATVVFSAGARAFAANTSPSLECPTSDGEFTNYNYENCDLSVDKQVSVNGGAFVEADTAAEAANAHVGDTITYQVTVTNTNSDFKPTGTVLIKDILPAGVTYVSNTATAGTYAPNDGSYNQNLWVLPLTNSDFFTNLPATLTITTKSNATGLYENNAALAYYDTGSCDGARCPYSDANSQNDNNSAWIDPSAPPAVLAASTTAPPQVLADTGSPAGVSVVSGIFVLAATLAVTIVRRHSNTKTSV